MRSQAPCRYGVSFNDVEGRELEVVRSNSTEVCLSFYLTNGALTLPEAEMRALVAHGLGHLHLDHTTTTGRRVSTRTGRGTESVSEQARLYTPEEETAADRYAANLLTAVTPGPLGEGCLALGAVLERAVAEGSRWDVWIEQHPLTPARAAAARGFCPTRR